MAYVILEQLGGTVALLCSPAADIGAAEIVGHLQGRVVELAKIARGIMATPRI